MRKEHENATVLYRYRTVRYIMNRQILLCQIDWVIWIVWGSDTWWEVVFAVFIKSVWFRMRGFRLDWKNLVDEMENSSEVHRTRAREYLKSSREGRKLTEYDIGFLCHHSYWDYQHVFFKNESYSNPKHATSLPAHSNNALLTSSKSSMGFQSWIPPPW